MEIKNYIVAFMFGIVLILLLPVFLGILNVALPSVDALLPGFSLILLILFFLLLISKILKFM